MDKPAPTWSRPPHLPALKAGQVDIWRFSLELDAPALVQVAAVLDEEECGKLSRLRQAHLRRRFAASHGRLRQVLASYLDCNPTALQFARGPHGKPALQTEPDLHFNLSHSRDQALLAVVRGKPVGVDLEYIRTDIEAVKLAERFFSEREAQGLEALPAEVRAQAFFSLWTRKEALVKVVGTNIIHGLREAEVDLGDPDRTCRFADADWQLHVPPIFENYAAAVALAPGAWDLRYLVWD